jgi:hypothetical protein
MQPVVDFTGAATMSQRHTSILLAITTSGACLFWGCADTGKERAWAGSVTDSVGIRIVANPEAGLWSQTPPPTVTVVFRSSSAGDPGAQLADVVSLARRDDGHVFALDRQEQVVQEFAPGGSWLRTIGRPGRGPGELTNGVDALWLGAEDTVMVADIGAQRVMRFTREGMPAGSVPIPMSGGIAYGWRADTTGRVLHSLVVFGPEGVRMELVVARDRHGNVTDSLFELPLHERMTMGPNGPVLTIFAPEALWDVGSDGSFVSAVNDRYRIRHHDRTGRVEFEFTYPETRQALGPADQDVYRDAVIRLWLSRMPPSFHATLRQNARFHDTYPSFAAIRLGPMGTTWVQRFRRAAEIPESERENLDAERDLGGPRWDVFDPEGRYLGVIELPARFTPLLFRGMDVYGIERDTLDVQSVVAVRLSGFAVSTGNSPSKPGV